ncbi:MAG TPA: OB-fold domain-containing protein [Woeseiaceae bacterium]
MAAEMLAQDLFEFVGERPYLLGGRHKSQGSVVFPMPQGSEAELYTRVRLADEGKLWSFTVQRFRPKSPPYAGAETDQNFKPYALGYIELKDQVIVEARILCESFDALRIGMPMQLCIEPFEKGSGERVLSYAFTPAQEPRS